MQGPGEFLSADFVRNLDHSSNTIFTFYIIVSRDDSNISADHGDWSDTALRQPTQQPAGRGPGCGCAGITAHRQHQTSQ